MHDSMLKNMPSGVVSYELAELMEINENFTKVAFRLRPGLKFHDGSDLTTEDVGWTYQEYRGVNAKVFHDKLDATRADGGIQIVDPRVIIFHFSEPFLDFVGLYNANAAGIGWILPKAYYTEVGPEKFKQNPIGAGPFKFIRTEDGGQKMIFEAFDDYWRRAPGTKTLTFIGIREPTLRLAGLQTGEIDMASGMTGDILKSVQADPNLTWDPNPTNVWTLFFPGYNEPDSPFNDKRVRQAVSLSLNRSFLSQLETEGAGKVWGGVVNADYSDSAVLPLPEENVEKAKQLLADAGYPNGFTMESLVPFVPYFSLGERILTDMGNIGITATLETLDGPGYRAKVNQGREGFSGNSTIVKHIFGIEGKAASWIRSMATCDGSLSFICEPVIEDLFARREASLDLEERDELSRQMQTYVVEEFLAIPVYINSFVFAAGPNVVGHITDYFSAIQTAYPTPYEDWMIKGEE
jgi:peptide/nickel transport system substrate-binding protein